LKIGLFLLLEPLGSYSKHALNRVPALYLSPGEIHIRLSPAQLGKEGIPENVNP